MKLIAWIAVFLPFLATAHIQNFGSRPQPVLADLKILRDLGIPVMVADEVTQIGYTYLEPISAQMISDISHQSGKCGPFYVLPDEVGAHSTLAIQKMNQIRSHFLSIAEKNISFLKLSLAKDPEIEKAVAQVNSQNLRQWTQTLSDFPTRSARSSSRNDSSVMLQTKLQELLLSAKFPTEVQLLAHRTTPQNSVLVRIPGKSRPEEIVVLGAHLDSITGFGSSRAPGADDNGSGSANLIETLRILALGKQPERTIEMYWYAAEELGLVGSGEIARGYKAQQKDVVAVMQLDMTAFPGEGINRIGSISDYTDPWLQAYMKEIVSNYIPGVTVIDFRCGYGCSDHASWFNEGYPSFAPFEATMDTMNRRLHTPNDIIASILNFEHSAIFSKIALAYLMDFSNSSARVP